MGFQFTAIPGRAVVNQAVLRGITEQRQHYVPSATMSAEISVASGRLERVVTERTKIPVTSSAKWLDASPANFDQFEFDLLADQWIRGKRTLSSFSAGAMNDPNYLRIVGMGQRAVPCILRQLKSELEAGEPDHWFLALWSITGEDPVPEDHQGRIKAMAKAWLAWGERRGLLNVEGVGSGVSASR